MIGGVENGDADLVGAGFFREKDDLLFDAAGLEPSERIAAGAKGLVGVGGGGVKSEGPNVGVGEVAEKRTGGR